jgi:6-pyruvoyltetrahydropterin/6-carboxytetrahydropterin synthase
MIIVAVDVTFDAAHRLMNYKGKCSNLHGHTYKVTVRVAHDNVLDHYSNMLIDFSKLKKIAEDAVKWYDHATILNVADPLGAAFVNSDMAVHFVEGDPTAELLAKCIHDSIVKNKLVKGCRVSVEVWETPTSRALYTED